MRKKIKEIKNPIDSDVKKHCQKIEVDGLLAFLQVEDELHGNDLQKFSGCVPLFDANEIADEDVHKHMNEYKETPGRNEVPGQETPLRFTITKRIVLDIQMLLQTISQDELIFAENSVNYRQIKIQLIFTKNKAII